VPTTIERTFGVHFAPVRYPLWRFSKSAPQTVRLFGHLRIEPHPIYRCRRCPWKDTTKRNKKKESHIAVLYLFSTTHGVARSVLFVDVAFLDMLAFVCVCKSPTRALLGSKQQRCANDQPKCRATRLRSRAALYRPLPNNF
jgi:hypothetical protein